MSKWIESRRKLLPHKPKMKRVILARTEPKTYGPNNETASQRNKRKRREQRKRASR